MSSALPRGRIASIAALLLLVTPVGAAASGDDVIQDCNDDRVLSKTYTQAEYKEALANLPGDVDEYSDCRDIIKRARLRKATGRDSGGDSGATGSPGAKPKLAKHKQKKIERQINSPELATATPLRIGDALIKPGDLRSSSTIPAPLIAVLVLALLGAAGASAIAIRRIVLGRRSR